MNSFIKFYLFLFITRYVYQHEQLFIIQTHKYSFWDCKNWLKQSQKRYPSSNHSHLHHLLVDICLLSNKMVQEKGIKELEVA